MRTNIPESALPHELDDPNRLSTTYTTLTLFTHPGPLAARAQVRTVADVIADYLDTAAVLEDLVDFRRKYDEEVRLPEIRPGWLDPYIQYGEEFRTHGGLPVEELKRRLGDFAAAQPARTTLPGHEQQSGGVVTSVDVGDEAVEILGTEGVRMDEPIELRLLSSGQLSLGPGGSLAGPRAGRVQPNSPLMRVLRDTGEVGERSREVSSGMMVTEMRAQQRHYHEEAIFHQLAKTGIATSELAERGLLGTGGEPLLTRELSRASDDPVRGLAAVLGDVGDGVDREQLEIAEEMIELARPLLRGRARALARTLDDVDIKRQLARYTAGIIGKRKPLGHGGLKGRKSLVFHNDREWAFQRTERLDMILGRPVFRGPMAAESVAPGSERSRSEQITSATTSLTARRRSRSEATVRGQLRTIGQRFSQTLNNLTESGIQDENAFSRESTFLGTLSERRRSMIDSVISQVSQENETQAAEAVASEATSTRSYTTRGRDDDQATTELAFQVVSPAQVQVRIEDVGLVWSPYIRFPFIGLQRLVRRHEQNSEREYLEQNLITDPVRPPEQYDVVTFQKEVDASGRHREQSYVFDFPVPPEYDAYELHRDGCKIDFRNGTSKDYNWSERWNWDDLENWDADFVSLESTGSRVKGEAKLTTTDPEHWNRGFLVITIALRKLTAESVSALDQYQRNFEEAENRRRAVVVQARQYARMRRRELIDRYAREYDLKETVFSALVRQVFADESPEHQTYFQEVVRSGIDWSKAAIRFEHARPAAMPYPEYPTDHFMNTPGVRFTLPIHRASEDAFFRAIDEAAINYYQDSAETVRGFVGDYRETLEDLKANDPSALVVDDYSREMVLGYHLEAVLSNSVFRNDG